MRIVVADIGGTHARFALADLAGPGDRPRIGAMHKYRSRDFDGLASAWAAFRADVRETLPDCASIAIAAPIEGEVFRFVNNDWKIPRYSLARDLGLDRLVILNDFGAVAHAVSLMAPDELVPIVGTGGLPGQGIVTVLGPGTGLGVALLDRRTGGVGIIETEAAHIGFAPQDEAEFALATRIAAQYGRTSIERIVSGPGLIHIYRHLGGEGDYRSERAGELWSAAIDSSNPVAARALDLLVGAFGAFAGDISLAHGAMGIAITGGLANRMADRLKSPLFRERFLAKGRYRDRMLKVPVVLATHPEPGLLGAAIAFQNGQPA